MDPVLLGHVDLPEGILVILDPGLGRFWRGDGDPKSPRANAPPEDESLARIPHTERARQAIASSPHAGTVLYGGFTAVAIGELPSRGRVVAQPMPDGEFASRWRSIDVLFDEPRAEPPRKRSARRAKPFVATIQGVAVEHGQLLFAGLGPLGHFRMWESLDGLADYVIAGRDAEAVAVRFGAPALGDGTFGFRDLPLADVGMKAKPIQAMIAEEELAAYVDYRPHCNLERLNAQIRERGTGVVDLDGSAVVGCNNRWGDGVFDVTLERAPDGQPLGISVALGTPERQVLFTRMIVMRRKAIATRKVIEGARIVFADRMRPSNDDDSGWFFSAGTETDAFMKTAGNLVAVAIESFLRDHPELDPIITAPVGARFRRKGKRFVTDDA